MKTLSLELPDFVDVDNLEAKTILAAQLYKQGKLSLGQAAEVAALSKRAFAEILGRYGVSLFGTDPSELKEDLKNA